MNRFVRNVMRVFLILAFFAALVIVAALIYVRTNSFGGFLQSRVSDILATEFRGQITFGKIDGSGWGVFVIHGLTIEYDGETIVQIPRIQLGYSLIPLLWREARIEIIADGPAINLQRERDGETRSARRGHRKDLPALRERTGAPILHRPREPGWCRAVNGG